MPLSMLTKIKAAPVKERMTGSGHATREDTLNRLSEEILLLSGFNIANAFRGMFGPLTNIRAYSKTFDSMPSHSVLVNEAITDLNAKSDGGVLVIGDDTTVILGGTPLGPSDGVLPLALAKSKVKILGLTRSSVIKLANGVSAQGDYNWFSTLDEAEVEGFWIYGVTFDGNAANNLVEGDTGEDIRRGYPVWLQASRDFRAVDCIFKNIPGRNCLNLGANQATPATHDPRIIGNHFHNIGAAAHDNNKPQSDASAVYCQADGGLVAHNKFWNDDIVDPTEETPHEIAALEIHGSRTDVVNNHVRNFTLGGHCPATAMDQVDVRWVDNRFEGITRAGLSLWVFTGKTHRGLKLINTHMELHTDLLTVEGGLYQSLSNGVTQKQIEDIEIDGLRIVAATGTALAMSAHGVQFCAVKGLKINRLECVNMQTAGLALIAAGVHAGATGIEDVDIDTTDLKNCGIHTGGAVPYHVMVYNDDVAKLIRNVRFRKVLMHKDTAAGQAHGLRVIGGGHIQDLIIGPDVRGENIADPANIISFVTTTHNRNVVVVPRVSMSPNNADPIRGNFRVGHDIVYHTNPVAAGWIGRTPTTSGGCSEAQWQVSTTYVKGQWIRTSGNKILECLVGGTSDDDTEPNPSTLGGSFADGTVTWAYRDSNAAVFKTFGEIAP